MLGWPSPWGSVFSLINLAFNIFRKWFIKDFKKKSFLVCIPNVNYKLYVRFKDALYAYLSMFIDAIMLEEKLMQILSIFRKTEP